MDKNKYVYIMIGVGILVIVIGYFFINFKREDEDYIDESLILEEDYNETEINNNEIAKIKIHITGEVKNEGIVELEEGARIYDAIKIAGDVTEFADLSKVNLAYELSDGQKVYIPSKNEEIEEYVSLDAGENVLEASEVIEGKININIADSSALQTINGVGESLAGKIIAYRELNGKFKSIEDLKNVSGIGEKKFEDIKDKVVVK